MILRVTSRWVARAAVVGRFAEISALATIAVLAGILSISALGVAAARARSRVTATAATASNWPKFGYDLANTGYNPQEKTLSAANVSGLTKLWSFQAPGGVRSSPAVVNGVVYVAFGDGRASGIYALKAATGAKLWLHNLGSGYLPSDPTVVNGVVYVSANGLYALKASSGAVIWHRKFGAGDAVVVRDVVYVPAIIGRRFWGGLFALKASTGAMLWGYKGPGRFTRYSVPAVADGVVYTSGTDDHVYALKASSGALLWRTKLESEPFRPTVTDGFVLVGDMDGYLWWIDAATGVRQCSQLSDTGITGPTVANGVAYVGDVGYSVADCTKQVWTYTGQNQVGEAAAANGVLYGYQNGPGLGATALALDASSGAALWSYPIKAHNAPIYIGNPVVADGRVYVGTWGGPGVVYAFALR